MTSKIGLGLTYDNIGQTLEILNKIISFEKKTEINRYLFFVTVLGFVGIIGGWIEYICYRYLGVDATFFIFGVTGNSKLAPDAEPILFLSLWMIYLLPVVAMIIFTGGISPGFLNWNRAYRTIGIIAITLFALTHSLILLLGIPNTQFIPVVWGSAVGFGFILAGYILFSETRINEVRLGLYAFGGLTIVSGIISSIVVFPVVQELAMFLLSVVLGLILIGGSMFTFIFLERTQGLPRSESSEEP